jgi:hypothetical protein
VTAKTPPKRANFEISIDGVPRSYRDIKEYAIEGGLASPDTFRA